MTPALAVLGTTLAVSGCCVVQWAGHGEPLALGSWGTLYESPSHAEARRLTGHDDTGCGAGFFDTEPPLSMAVSTRAGRTTLSLMIWGTFPGRLGSGLLRVLLRSIEHGRRSPLDEESRTPVRSAHHPDLIFPAGYRPGTSPAMTALYTQMRSLLIRAALHRTGGKKIDACSLLGLSRNGLDKKMKRLHIEGPREGQSP